MKIHCSYCQAKCRIDESKIPANGAHVRCPSCREIFFLSAEDIKRGKETTIPEAILLTGKDKSDAPAEKISASAKVKDSDTRPAAAKPTTESMAGRWSHPLISRPLFAGITVSMLITILILIFWVTGHQPVIQSKNSSLAIPNISSQVENQALKEMTSHALVGDAAISQQGETVSLSLLVDQSTPPAYALKMGRQFIDTVKRLTGSNQTDKKHAIFPHYQFHLFIYYPNGKEVTEQLSNSGDIRDN